jgi:acyl-CoA thioesterase-1
MPKLARPARTWLRRLPAALTALAALAPLLLAATQTRAEEVKCPGSAAALDTNGAIFTIPRGGVGQPLDILAIGSSSTEGVGATTPAHTYPAQLEDELTHRDGIAARVKNAGVGGELAAKTLQRLLVALKTGSARLVIWQVGTNDAIVGVDEALFRVTVEKGVAAARAAGVQLLLMDPQFTAKSQDEARFERFVAIVDETGARDRVPVLSRFALMKRWGAKGALALLSGDGLHMNDRGYQCIAHAIAEAIEGAIDARL